MERGQTERKDIGEGGRRKKGKSHLVRMRVQAGFIERFVFRRYREEELGLWSRCRRGALLKSSGYLSGERCHCATVAECCWEMFTTAETHPINNIAAEH